jgi:hypothetical protein
MTEQEYWRDHELIRRDITIAIQAFYTYIEIYRCAAESKSIYDRINKEASFWTLQLYALQATFFIVLGRIFDKDKDVLSIRKFIDATKTYKGFFSKRALEARRTPAGQPRPSYLDEYMQKTHEPSIEELEALSEALKTHEEKYRSVYAPIRHEVFAHTGETDDAKVSNRFSRTQINDIEETLYFLHDLLITVQQLYHDGIKPVLGNQPKEYGDKSRYKETARRVLNTLS